MELNYTQSTFQKDKSEASFFMACNHVIQGGSYRKKSREKMRDVQKVLSQPLSRQNLLYGKKNHLSSLSLSHGSTWREKEA